MPGACSRGIHALLNDLDQPVELINVSTIDNFKEINPSKQVPVLVDGDLTLREGAAIILHLLEKHQNPTLPKDPEKRAEFYQWLMIANATLHPAYGRMFFIMKAIEDEAAQKQAYEKNAKSISALWSQIDKHLQDRRFMSGDQISAIDMMLAVYSTWGGLFPVEITLGKNVERMVAEVQQYPAFQKAVQAEEGNKDG
jgi:glutathione S-transferase